jgi:hypothetical protein
MKVIYLAHPVSGDVTGNLARARRWLRWIYDNFDVAVIADWVLTCEVLDDSRPAHRAHGLAMDRALVEICDEFWMVGGRVSGGMQTEREMALGANVIVRNLTWLGEEPPAEMPEQLREALRHVLREAA